MSIVAEKKEKQYVSDNAQLMAEWDWAKNTEIGLDPKQLTCGIKTTAWWICPKGHSYEARIDAKNRGTTCPYCANRKVLAGFNDALTLIPEITQEWYYEENFPLLPNDVVATSRKKVHFRCNRGHKYQMAAGDFLKGYSCPVCVGRKIIPRTNDFASYDARLLEEWDFSKNTIDPTSISPNYYRKVWWLGKCNHSWKASVYSRTKMGTNCPICSQERHASVSEKSVLYYVKKYIPFDVLENYRGEHIQLELDIYIPQIKTAIEYDGERWHQDTNSDIKKDIMCEGNGIRLIRIREKGCPSYISQAIKIELPNNKTTGVEEGIKELLELLCVSNVNVNIERDLSDILSMMNFMVKEQSLSVTHPDIAKEWHPTKNGNLRPEHTRPNSNKKVWWLCPKGHEYQTEVYFRTKRGNACPICSGHRVQTGYNDLYSQNPLLAKEWNYKRNIGLDPTQVTFASSKKVWWICEKGHEWQTSISHRAAGQNCPVCAGRTILKGYNDLETLRPDLMEEWDYDKKVEIHPSALSLHSGKKVWWICKRCGNSWQATVDKRSNGRGCPKCAKRKIGKF